MFVFSKTSISRTAFVLVGLLLFFGKLLYDLYAGANDAVHLEFANDLFNHILPYMTYASDTVRLGEFPLWNPYTALGSSMVGALGIGLFHPTIWVIFLLEDVAVALLVNQLLTVCIGMAGMYVYGRYLGFKWPALVLSTTLLGYTAFTEGFSHTEGSSYCWLPLILYFTHRCFDQPTLRMACCIALSLSMCFLGGFPNFFFYTCLIVGSYFGVLLICTWPKNKLVGSARRVGLMVVAVVMTTGLVAMQLLPAYELSTLSVRSLYSTAIYNPNSIWENFSVWLTFGNFLFPDQAFVYGNPLLRMEYGIYYIGAGMLLVPFAFTHKQHRTTALALSASCLIIVLFVLSYQIPALSFVRSVPLIGSLQVNGRAVASIEFFMIVLAGLGVSAISNRPNRVIESTKATIWGALLLTVATVAVITAALTGAKNVWAVIGLSLGGGLIIYSMLSHGSTSRAGRLGWVIVVLIVVDVSIHRNNRILVPAFSNKYNAFVEQSNRDYKAMDDHYRLLLVPASLDDTYTFANLGMKFGIPNISAYDNLTQARWMNYLRTMVGPKVFDRGVKNTPLQRFYGDFTPQLSRQVQRDNRILGLASVRYLYTAQGKIVNEEALPRAYAVQHYVKTKNEKQSLAAIKSNMATLSTSVVLENANPTFSSNIHAKGGKEQSSDVQIKRYMANEVELAVSVTKPSIVVLTDAFYPGWNAYLDGRKVDIFRANSLFRAVEVPAGNHTVVFRYSPTSFYWGMAISLATLCFALVLVIVERHYQRQKAGKNAQ